MADNENVTRETQEQQKDVTPETQEQQQKDVTRETQDNKQDENVTRETPETFDADKYVESLTKDLEPQQDLTQLKQENQLLQQKLHAVTNAYIELKKTGVSVLSSPGIQQNQQNQQNQNPMSDSDYIDEVISKWVK